jgi:hypothetical protein
MHKLAMYSPFRSRKKGNLKASPFVSLAVGSHSMSSDGQLLLSAQLMTDSEIDYEVDGIIKELEVFRKAAKKELRTLQAKILAE